MRPQQHFESSSFADQPSEAYEEGKASLSLSMKAPLDSKNMNRNKSSNSVGPNKRNKDGNFNRSNSATKAKPRNIADSHERDRAGDLIRIDPISIPFSKGKLYHYLNFSEVAGVSLNPPIKAPPNWFMQVYKNIFRSYSYLQTAVCTSELFKTSEGSEMNVRDALLSGDKNGSEFIFEDIMASLQEQDASKYLGFALG